ncbi:MAG: hypothetical protein K1X89_13740 [Myxococcaceae bacterium]|nr:hypothetical protein [Myxococcaceae bacterium]
MRTFLLLSLTALSGCFAPVLETNGKVLLSGDGGAQVAQSPELDAGSPSFPSPCPTCAVDYVGVATKECGPTDGPAIGLHLSMAPIACGAQTYLTLDLWREEPTVGTYAFSQGSGQSTGMGYVCGREECSPSYEGRVTITASDAKVVEGSFEVTFRDQGTFKGNFRVDRCSLERPLCG